MNLDGRRESTNVEDRRGMSGGMKAGLGGGIMGIVIALLAMFMGGGNMGDVLGNLGNMIQVEEQPTMREDGKVEFSEEATTPKWCFTVALPALLAVRVRLLWVLSIAAVTRVFISTCRSS